MGALQEHIEHRSRSLSMAAQEDAEYVEHCHEVIRLIAQLQVDQVEKAKGLEENLEYLVRELAFVADRRPTSLEAANKGLGVVHALLIEQRRNREGILGWRDFPIDIILYKCQEAVYAATHWGDAVLNCAEPVQIKKRAAGDASC